MTAPQYPRIDMAGLAVLIVLQLLMLASLYTRTEPHPPIAVPLFALAPFLSASIALAAAAMILEPAAHPIGRVATVCAAAAALVSFGPQKWIDPSIAQIWPAVLLAQIACVTLLARAIRGAGQCRAGATERSYSEP